MQFNDKINNFSSKNLPFKSMTTFIIPFSVEQNYDDVYFESIGFSKYDYCNKVKRVKDNITSHLNKPYKNNASLLSVYEKNINSKMIFNIDTEIYKLKNDDKTLLESIEFVVDNLRVYYYCDHICFACITVRYSANRTIDEIMLVNHCAKYNEHYIDTFSDSIKSVSGLIKSKIPKSQKKCESFLNRLLKNQFDSEITIISKEAYVFNVTYCNENEFDDANLFNLASGNNPNFKYSDDVRFIKEKHGEFAMQGIVKNGIARIVIENDNDNNYYYNPDNPNGMINSVLNNYIFVCILVLRQYYGFNNLNSLILEKVNKTYNEGNGTHYKEFLAHKKDGELFYVENVFVEVSHLMYLEDTYQKMREILNINAIIDDFYRDSKLCDAIIEDYTVSAKMKKISKSAIAVLSASIVTIVTSILQVVLAIIFR